MDSLWGDLWWLWYAIDILVLRLVVRLFPESNHELNQILVSRTGTMLVSTDIGKEDEKCVLEWFESVTTWGKAKQEIFLLQRFSNTVFSDCWTEGLLAVGRSSLQNV